MPHDHLHGIVDDGYDHFIWRCDLCDKVGRTFSKFGAHKAWALHWLRELVR